MTWSVKIDILNRIMFHTDSSLNRRADGNKTFTSKWKLFSTEQLFKTRKLLETREVLYTRQLSHKAGLFWIGTRANMTWSVKIDILNWIMFHTDSRLNRRADGNKTFTREMKELSTEHLFEPRRLLETREVLYAKQLSHKAQLFWIGTRWKMTWSVKIDILNWIMFDTDSSLNWRAIWNKTFTREMKVIINRTLVWTKIVVGN